jgi:hypothetical protein
MTADRIKEIQSKTAFPNSVSVCQALLQVWNECEQDNKDKKYTESQLKDAIRNTITYLATLSETAIINSLNKQD